ncbi:MAG: aldehyde ferredoxin oxidoreductase family protein [Candidatus Nezhaarchaeales archaeon]
MMDPSLYNVLYIDLTERKYEVQERRDLFEKYLGGTGVAIKLLEEECPKGVDPFSPDNPIIFAVGPLTGLYPLASKTVAMFKSPLTGNLGESHAGGRSAVAIRLAGYGAIVIKGASKTPVYISIFNDQVKIKDATTLWGMRSSYAVGRVLREVEPGAGKRTIMRIGIAGENLVRYANVVVESYRHFGRLGLGAVFGSKKLKAIVVAGTRSVKIDDLKAYMKVYEEIFRSLTETGVMSKYHVLGTAENVLPLNAMGALPTRNLMQTRFELAENISGEALAEKYLVRKIACTHCPIGCIHLASLRIAFAPGHEYETLIIPYDYEPIYSLGSMLGIGSVEGLLRLIEKVEGLGLDAISTGVAMAWATEAYQRGLISDKETMGLKPNWGEDVEVYIRMAERIAKRANEFYSALADGVEFAASKYGGLDFALACGGNEVPGYHTGPAALVGFLVGPRHSHLDSAGYGIDQKALRSLMTKEEMVRQIVEEERFRNVLTSLVVCLFARGEYKLERVVKALEPVGIKTSSEELMRLGAEIQKAKASFKAREGYSPYKVRIAKRFLETPTPLGKLNEEELRSMIKMYIEMAGLESIYTSSN